MSACVRCHGNPADDPTIVLVRQNPLGEDGLWLCTSCGARVEDPVLQDIVDVTRQPPARTQEPTP